MPVRARLGSRSETVEAGGSAAFELLLHNEGPTPETLRLSVTGAARPFSWVAPDTLPLEPGQEAVVRVGFHMPSGAMPLAGSFPFQVAIATSSGEVVDGGASTEGVLELAPFSSLSVSLAPQEGRGKAGSRHQLSIANRGNAPTAVNLTATGAEGLDVRVQPSTVVAAPNQPVTASVEVTARSKLFTGDDRELGFTVLATPEVGSVVETRGSFVQQAAVAARTLVTSSVVAGGLVLALVLWATVFSNDSSTTSAGGQGTDPPTTAASCPAEGHTDNFGVSGLRPDDIPRLPNTYSFFAIRDDGCNPVRFNPCEPVHYIQNAALAPPTGAADVREAFNKLSQATGITFVDDGLTDEVNRRNPYLPERYGDRWAPILVSWMSFGEQSRDPAIQVVGRGIGQRRGDVFVSGTLSLNIDAVTDKDAGTPLEGGFGPPLGSGTGAVGAKGVTWGRVILHELAHVVGLGHTRDRGAIMYPETAEQTSRPAEFKEPDMAGLRYLGREAGCLPTPTPG